MFAVKSFGMLAAAAALAAAVVSAPAAEAATFGFDNIAGGDTIGDALNSYFSLTVTDQGSSTVLLSIASAVNGGAYFIGGIFIDDAVVPLLSSLPLNDTVHDAAVAYTRTTKKGANDPKNFPQGNLLTPAFVSTATYLSDNGAGNAKAVQPNEVVAFLFGGSYASIIAGLTSGDLRLGLHVQGIGSGSDSFISGDPVSTVPLPAGMPLLIGALGGLAALRLRRPS